MPFVPIRLPPGVSRSGTARQNTGRWYDCNMVRWVQGFMQPIGGWQKSIKSPFTTKVCGIHAWWTQADNPPIAIGLTDGLYIVDSESQRDISPEGIVAGRPIARQGLGFGSQEYDRDAYGTEREGDTSLILAAANWTMDNFGSFLIGCLSSDGRLFYYDPAPGEMETAEVIPTAPVGNTAVLTTNERHLMVIGTEDFRNRIAWSGREDFDDWQYAERTSLAGFLNLQTDGRLQTGIKVGPEILVLSDVDAFRVSYVGSTLVYGASRVGTACGIAGPRAIAAADDFAVWMGRNGFYLYDGRVKPLDCDVWDWVYRDINALQFSQVVAGHNAEFNEIWFFFATTGSDVNNRYVAWNYRDNHWSIGYFGRDAWTGGGVTRNPYAAGTDGMLFEHEVGYLAAGRSRYQQVYAETAPIEMGNGDNVMHITRMVPDPDLKSTARLQYQFLTRFTPVSEQYSFGPFSSVQNGYINMRFTGRQISMRVTARADGDWRLGDIRLDVKSGGLR